MSYTKSRSWTQRVNEKLDDDTRAMADELGWKLPEILNKRMEERIPATEEQY